MATEDKSLSRKRLKQFHHLETIALMLDEAIQSGEIMSDAIDKTQKVLDKMADVLIDKQNPDSKTYILYEVQALIHWIKGKEARAYDFVSVAVELKGDKKLFTETGKLLAKNLK